MGGSLCQPLQRTDERASKLGNSLIWWFATMIKMLIIADDFTGALDTGVKFSAAGSRTKVSTDVEMDFTSDIPEEVLVLCAPTRHLPAREAYHIIRRISERAAAAQIGCIFKKTDSALRGNIGAELSAVLDGSGETSLCFIPALPGMNRVTIDGVHYIDGVPVHQSVFGQDPFEPVRESRVPDLLHLQCGIPVKVIPSEGAESFQPSGETCIYLFDCASKEDMEKEVRTLYHQGCLKVLAGCAGLAESLPPYLELAEEHCQPAEVSGADRLIVVCGSVNPISCSQMDYGEQRGYRRVHISSEQLLHGGSLCQGSGAAMMDALWSLYCQSPHLMIDSLQSGGEHVLEGTPELTLEEIRQKISRRMGLILKELVDRGADARIMIIGGDTLLAFLESIQCHELTPICELQPGVVLSRITYRGRRYEVISKSGGFGEEDLLVTLQGECEATEEQPAVS